MTCIYHKHHDQTDKIDLVDRLTTGTMHANIQASNERFNLLFVGIPKHSTKKKSQFFFKKSWLYRGLISMQNFIFQTHDKNNYHHIQTASPKHVL